MPRVDVPEHGTFVDFPDGTPPEEMQAVLSSQFPKKPGLIDRAVKGPLARAAQGVNSSLGSALSAFGLDSGAEAYKEGAEYWKKKADAAGSSGIPAQIYEGLGGAPMGVAEFVAGVPYAGAKGAVAGYREGGVPGALKEGSLEAVKRAGIGKIFHGIGNANLTPLQRTGAMAGTMGAQTAAEGGSLADTVAATATGALLMPPSGGGAQSVVRSRMQRAGASPEVAADLSGRFNPDIQPAGMGSINANNVDTMFASDPARPPAIRDSEVIALTGNESRPPQQARGTVLDAENASRLSPYDAIGPAPGTSIEVARLKQEHPYWSDAEYLKEVQRTTLTQNPEVLPARTDADRYAAPPAPAERPGEQAPSRTVEPQSMENFNHDSLPTAAGPPVLQDAAPVFTPLDTTRSVAGKEMYHGAKKGVENLGDVDPIQYSNESALFGPGLYLTDSRTIADGYAKGKGGGGKVLPGKLGDVRLLDLEKPADPQIQQAFADTLRSFDEVPHGKTPTEMYNHLAEVLRDNNYSKSDAADVLYGLQTIIEDAGYDGFKHTGGQRTTKGKEHGPHNVVILFDTGHPDKGIRTRISPSGPEFNHDSLPTAAVTAKDSLVLQDAAPQLKIAVVGTPAEIKALGKQPAGKTTWVNGDKAYIIDAKAAREKYGSVLEAKRALKAGGDAESEALGYPARGESSIDTTVNNGTIPPKQSGGDTMLRVTDIAKSVTEVTDQHGNVYPAAEHPEQAAKVFAHRMGGVADYGERPLDIDSAIGAAERTLARPDFGKYDQSPVRDKAQQQLDTLKELKALGVTSLRGLYHTLTKPPAPLQTAAVTKAGEILTEPESIKQAATVGEVAYAAEGAPADLAAKIEPVADALKPTVYHGGSREALNGIKIPAGGDGLFYTSNPRVANVHALRNTNRAIHAAELDIKNPYVVDYKGTDITRNNAEEAIREAKALGHDGVIIKNFIDMPENKLDVAKRFGVAHKYKSDVYVAFSPDQVKNIREVDRKGGGESEVLDPAGVEPTMLHAGIHLPTLLADAKKVWKHYTEKLDPTAPAGSLKAEFDKNRKANEKFGSEPLLNKMRRAAIDSSANVQAALMRLGPTGEHVRRQFDAISGASAKAQLAVEKQREALSGMSLREQQAMGDMVAIDRDLAISKPGYTKIFGKTDAELRAARASFQQDYKLTDAEMARVENATRQYFDAWKQNTQRMLDAGLIDATQKQALDAQDYSPKQFLEKIDPDSQAFSAIGGGRVTVPDSGIKRLKEGSDQYFRNNPMRLLSEATARIETRIARNEANQELAKLPTGNGIAEVVKPGTPAPAGYEALTYMENGQQKTIHMKSEYAKEWRQNDPLINSELVNWLQWLSGAKLVRAGATGYNPAFLVTNVPRDLVTIWMQAEKKGYSKHAPVAMAEVATDLVKVAGDAWKRKGRYVDYVKQGGGRELLTHEGALSARRENLAPAVAKVQKVLSYVNEFSEVVTRLAYRERMIKNGMDPASASKAAGEYVDFSRGGSVAKAVDRMGIPYLNAAIQGTRSIARAAGRDPGAFAYKTAQLMTGAAGIYALNQITNPEGWANVSDREKADNFIIMLPKAFEYTDKDGTTVSPYLKISKEQSTRPFTTVAELFTHWANGGKPTKQQLEMALGSAVPISIDKMPPAAAAFWTYALNADTYRKEPVWKGKQEIEPYAEYTNNTNPIYAAIGKATASPDEQGVMRGGISPERLKAGVEKIITPSNAYLQGVGNILTDLYEKMNPSDKVEFAKGNYEQLRAVPGISRLLGGAKDTEQFREGIREARTGTATQQFEVNKTLDAMVLRYVKTGKSDAALYDRISDFLDKQSGESRSRLENRITGLMETADLPDRGWWMAVRALQPEDRADQFKERLKTVSPEEQERMKQIADGLTGFVSDRFIERYEGAQ